MKEELRDLLLRWQSGKINERTIHAETDALWASEEWPDYPNHDPRSILVEALAQLSILSAQWITTEDIEPMLQFLDTPSGQEEQGWREWTSYWDNLDWAKRREALADNPYYSKSGPHFGEGTG